MRCISDDLPGYAREVLPWLLRDPVANNVAYTLIAQRIDGTVPAKPDAMWLRVLDRDSRLVGVALRTPPYGLLVTSMPEPEVRVLARTVADREPALPAVNGPVATSTRFAARYAELTGTDCVPVMSQRTYRLDRVTPMPAPGKLRAATRADRDLLVAWSHAFVREAVPHERPHPSETGQAVDRRLALPGRQWVWQHAGRAVSMAWLNPPAAGVVRVSGVYTPPELRRHGYAGACVAALSQYALDQGATACMLYTDLANPTSNAIYQRIGYHPVTEVQEWRLSAAG